MRRQNGQGASAATCGSRAQEAELRKQNAENLAIGVDLGGTKVLAGAVTSEGVVGAMLHRQTDKTSCESVFLQVVDLVSELLARPGFPAARSVVGIGIGVPGLVRTNGNVWAPNLPGWSDFPVLERMRGIFDMPIALDTDRAASMLGEQWLGAARAAKNAILVLIGTGIGAGILINGEVYRGHSGLSGSVGWIAMSMDEEVTGESREGSLERMAAGPGIAREALERIKAGAPTVIPELVTGDLGMVTAETVCKAARLGDAEALGILRCAGERIGMGIGNMISILNPELVVVGGGVGAAWELLSDPIMTAIARHAQPLAAATVRVVPSQLRGNAIVVGAARLAFVAAESANGGGR